MNKTDFRLCNKDADQLRSNCEADHTFVFAARIVQCPLLLNMEFQCFSLLLRLYRLVCVGPGLKPRRQVFSRCFSFGAIEIEAFFQLITLLTLLSYSTNHSFARLLIKDSLGRNIQIAPLNSEDNFVILNHKLINVLFVVCLKYLKLIVFCALEFA